MDGKDGSRRRLAVLLTVAVATVAAFAGTAVAVGAGSADRPDAKTRVGNVQKGGDVLKVDRTHKSGGHCHAREGRMGPGGAV